MTLFELLSNDERIIVASSKELNVIITWNQSVTFQMWQKKGRVNSTSCLWEETDIKTYAEPVRNFEHAREIARNWLNT